MNTTYALAIALALGTCTLSNAQPKDHIDLQTYNQPKPYAGHMVIRARTNSQSQLDAMLTLTESVWSERVGIGLLDIQIKQSNLDAITHLGIAHDVLIADLQTHTDTRWNEIVEIDRLEKLDQANNQQRGAMIHDDGWFKNYKQLDEIQTYIDNIVTLRPDMASTQIIGQSWEGRDMVAITITAPETPDNLQADRPAVFIFSTVHAREWIAPMTTTYFASKFVADYDSDPRVQAILDSTRIIIVPIGNPDGYLHTWSSSRYWRNTRRVNWDGSRGVNINRNWGYEWGNQGSSSTPSSTNYRGTKPFSEPETQALRDLALGLGDKLAAHIDYHSYSQLILWPFGYASSAVTPEPYRTYFDMLSNELSDDTLAYSGEYYEPMQSKALYAAAGDSSDWFFGELGVTSVTYELRTRSSFGPPPSNILPNAQENYHAFKLYTERTTQPIFVAHTPIDSVSSNNPTPITATIIDAHRENDLAFVDLFARSGTSGEFQSFPMTPDENAQYFAMLPPMPCGQPVEYYFQATLNDGSTHTYPDNGADNPLNTFAQEFVPTFADNFEADTGWTVGHPSDTATGGIWTRMDPEGTPQQPENDHSTIGSICWVTDGHAGNDPNDNDVDGGTTTLTSPTLDATNTIGEPYISFWLWHASSRYSGDLLQVDLSNDDGNSWTTFGSFYLTDQWRAVSIPISNTLTPTDQMRIRFIASDTGLDDTIESAIDDLRVESIGCPPTNPADINNDGFLNFSDISLFIAAYQANNLIADFNHDGLFNFYDIAAFLTAYTGA